MFPAQKFCSCIKEKTNKKTKKLKNLKIWSIADDFSAAVLHLSRVSSAFASTPGYESFAQSVNVKTFHYRAGRLFWSRLSWQLWNVCPHKTCLFNQFLYFQLDISHCFFNSSVYQSMLRTRVPVDTYQIPFSFCALLVFCPTTTKAAFLCCAHKYSNHHTNNIYCKANWIKFRKRIGSP